MNRQLEAMRGLTRPVGWCCFIVFVIVTLMSKAVHAGELVIYNTGPSTATCTVDGYTRATGWKTDRLIKVIPGAKFYVAQNYNQQVPVIDWVNCGAGLLTRKMQITPSGPDGMVVLNGQQTRTLNVLLYPYIPSNPNGNFQALTNHVIQVFQAAHPKVLLNVVMNPDIDIYSFANLPTLVGPQGYDVLELDTVFMNFLVSQNLVTKQQITGDAPWPPGQQAVTINGTLYGIPSWLCSYFIFGFTPAIQQVHTLNDFLAYLATEPSNKPGMYADFNGSWTVPSMYISSYVQQYGYGAIGKATTMPPDSTVINNLVPLVTTCRFAGTNRCVDGYFHSLPDGSVEKFFATGNSHTAMGFSERSFYIQLYETVPGVLNSITSTWGPTSQPVLYTDAFVTNRSTCNSGSCTGDSQSFTTLMTGSTMKTYIAFSQDLPSANPARHLLVATQPFWQTPRVQNDPLYKQFLPAVMTGQPYQNDFTDQIKRSMFSQVCEVLKQQITYDCGS